MALFVRLWTDYPLQSRESLFRDVLRGDWPDLISNPAYSNTCAIRLSVALNASGAPVSAAAGAANGGHKDGTGRHILVNVRNMYDYLGQAFGKWTWGMSHLIGTGNDFSFLPNMRGIMVYHAAFSDATGHVDLWDGTKFRERNEFSDVAKSFDFALWAISAA